MKRGILFLMSCLLVPVWAQGLTFAPSELVQSTDATLAHILPRPDRQEDSTAVLFIKTDILNVSVRGHVIDMPRRVNEGYVLFVPQGTTQLQLNAPLYQTQTLHFAPVDAGRYYEMRLSTREDPSAVKQAARRAKELDLNRTHVGLELSFDYMTVPEAVRQASDYHALVYLDKTLNFDQWQKLLMPGGPYLPFDVSGNPKNPCCIVVRNGEPIENVFRMKQVEMDSYVENLEGGNTYHTTLRLTPKN